MSGTQVSSFADPNILYKSLSGLGTAEVQQKQNELMQQQQDISGHEIEMGARLAGTLLDPSLYPTTEARAAAYPGLVARARALAPGYFKNAPATYPGDAATQALARMGTPSKDLLGLSQAGVAASDFGTRWGGGGGAATGGGTTAAAPATSGTIEPDALTRAQAVRDGLIKRGLDVDTATGFAANALHESGANPNVGSGDAGASHGTFQWNADRYSRYIALNGHPPDNAPLDEQLDFVIHELNTTEGAARDRINAAQGPAGKASAISQYYLRPKDVQAEIQRRSGTATQLATQWGGAGTSTTAPVITGDSLASSGGLGGSGVVGDSSAKVLARVQAESRAGKYDGKPVVLSTGASNDFGSDLGSVEQQLREAQAGNAGKITVLGVGPAVEAKAPGTNAKLQALAKSYGAQFVPLPADQMSPDGVHPTAQGYAALKAAIAPPQGARGGVAARTGGTDVAGPGAGTGGPPAASAPLPPQQAVAQAQATGQPVPVAGTQGLWALPNGNLTSTPPAATTAQAPPAQQPTPSQPPAPAPTAAQPAQPVASGSVAIPPPPRTLANDLTREQLAEIPVLKRQVQLGQITAAEADKVLLGYQTANRAAQRQYALDVQGQQEKAKADAIAAENLQLAQNAAARERAKAVDLTLQGGDDGSANYAAAYATKAAPVRNPDGSVVYPNMLAYDKPTYRGGKGQGADAAGAAPDYGEQRVTPPTIMTQDQAASANYADRMLTSNRIMDSLDDSAVTWAEKQREKAGNYVGYNINSPEYQRLRQAQENFLVGILRKESGAAVSQAEWERYAKFYFPMPGDDAATIKQKQETRDQAMSGLQREAGPAYKLLNTGPTLGQVEDGYRFKGGDPAKKSSWAKVQ